MQKYNKKLYESIMKDIAKIVKQYLNESFYNSNPYYHIEDEADESIHGYYQENELDDAIEDAKEMAKRSRPYGRFIVYDKDYNIVFDTNPDISFKF